MVSRLGISDGGRLAAGSEWRVAGGFESGRRNKSLRPRPTKPGKAGEVSSAVGRILSPLQGWAVFNSGSRADALGLILPTRWGGGTVPTGRDERWDLVDGR